MNTGNFVDLLQALTDIILSLVDDVSVDSEVSVVTWSISRLFGLVLLLYYN